MIPKSSRVASFALGLPIVALWLLAICSVGVAAQQAAAPAIPPPVSASPAEFAQAADEVLQNMSEITGLQLRVPLKKTLRSREDIRAYIIRQMEEDKDPAQRHADAKSAEAFGLLPKNFDLDSFMVDLLTEQITGLYDPKAGEFYIADWIPLDDQRPVMAHELTHALEDQHFHIDAWLKAARPNDDAELARESFLEGSAMAAMVDYSLAGTGQTMNNMPEFDPSLLTGDLGSTPLLKKAPPFIKDSLTFPYFAGMTFTAAVLKPAGWPALGKIFANPPATTQQILHPALYKSGHVPAKVELPSLETKLGKDWKKLDDNFLGEFGLLEVLKQFLDEQRATPLATAWEGDRYLLFENQKTQRLLLLMRLHLAKLEEAERFFGQYSELLGKKHPQHSNLLRRPNFFSFDTPEGGVFLRCSNLDCLVLEGGDRPLFVEVNKELGLGMVPEPDLKPGTVPTKTVKNADTGGVSIVAR